jgi:acyl-CoA synthetase (AMP-forming)/AMP-acid ligase II
MADPLLRLWRATVQRSPGAPALIEAGSGRQWSRAELAESASAWRAAAIGGRGLRGRRVLLGAANGAGWFQGFLGLLEAGAVPVLIDPAEPPEAQGAAARAVGASAVWTDGRLEPIAAGRVRPAAGHCLVKLTSGSTAAPRGIAFTHAQMAADGRQICRTMGIGADDLNLAVIPLGHSYGLGNLVMPLLLQGTAVLCSAGPLPHALAAECARWRPTVFPAVPALLRALALSDVSAADFASLRLVLSAGAVLPRATAAAFAGKFHCAVHGFYGSSETGGITYDRTGAATLEGRSVGPPLLGVRLTFHSGGRFSVASAAVHGAGRHRPGDRGRLNSAGELVLLGRADRTLKLAGRRVDLAEVEAAMLTVPGIREAYAAPHPQKAEALAAAVATALTPDEVRRRLRSRLAAWKVPARLVTLRELPTTARGKPDLVRLRQLLAAAPAAGRVRRAAPRQ